MLYRIPNNIGTIMSFDFRPFLKLTAMESARDLLQNAETAVDDALEDA